MNSHQVPDAEEDGASADVAAEATFPVVASVPHLEPAGLHCAATR